MSALRLIDETVISSTVATVNIQDIFSADFDVYKMTFTNFTSDADDSVISARILSPQGNPDHFSNYDYAVQEGKSSGSTGEDRGVGQYAIIYRSYGSSCCWFWLYCICF